MSMTKRPTSIETTPIALQALAWKNTQCANVTRDVSSTRPHFLEAFAHAVAIASHGVFARTRLATIGVGVRAPHWIETASHTLGSLHRAREATDPAPT
jgi:hypothetical protein